MPRAAITITSGHAGPVMLVTADEALAAVFVVVATVVIDMWAVADLGAAASPVRAAAVRATALAVIVTAGFAKRWDRPDVDLRSLRATARGLFAPASPWRCNLCLPRGMVMLSPTLTHVKDSTASRLMVLEAALATVRCNTDTVMTFGTSW